MDSEVDREEQAHLARILEIIRGNLEKLCGQRQPLKGDVLAARKEMWNDGPHIVRSFDDVIELNDADREVADRERQFDQNEREIARLGRMEQSPYFARLDFENAGGGGQRKVYIGAYSLRDGASGRVVVVDWRAPVASMFYDFDLGPCFFEAAGARRAVNITLKRQFKIEGGQLQLLYDTDSAMYDEILGQVLSGSTDRRLRVIVSSIQKEQNAAIRSDPGRSCLIYGLAGSGKTSVGMHRLAYLLYHDREKLGSENLLILSNNRLFGAYIAAILPELGESPAQQLTFGELLQTSLGNRYEAEGYYEQLRALEAAPDSQRARGLQIKYAPEFLRACIDHFLAFPFRAPELRYRGEVVLSQELLREKWQKLRFSSFKAARAMFEQLMRETVEGFFHRNQERVRADLAASREGYLSDREVDFLYRKLRKRYVTAALEEAVRINRIDPALQLMDLLWAYLEKTGGDTRIAVTLRHALEGKKLLFEDALLYLFVRVLMGETHPVEKVRHVVVDESQDCSPVQLYIMQYLYPKSSFTLLADIHQAVEPLTTVGDYGLYEQVFGGGLLKIRLSRCYRSSSEINALAFRLLEEREPNIREEYDCFHRPVKKPRYIVGPDPLRSIGQVLETLGRYKSVAVITKDEADAAAVGDALGDFPDVQVILSPDGELQSRVTVLPLLLAKGLEFDGVISLNFFTAYQGDARLHRKVYLGCTRALHELVFLERTLPAAAKDFLPYMALEAQGSSGADCQNT